VVGVTQGHLQCHRSIVNTISYSPFVQTLCLSFEILQVIYINFYSPLRQQNKQTLECGPMPNVMAALPNIGGAVCSTPQFD